MCCYWFLLDVWYVTAEILLASDREAGFQQERRPTFWCRNWRIFSVTMKYIQYTNTGHIAELVPSPGRHYIGVKTNRGGGIYIYVFMMSILSWGCDWVDLLCARWSLSLAIWSGVCMFMSLVCAISSNHHYFPLFLCSTKRSHSDLDSKLKQSNCDD